MLELISLEIDCDLPDEIFSALSEEISAEKRERLGRLRNRRAAVNTLMGEIAVRRMISERTGLRNDELKFAAGEYGKPYLAGVPRLHFNISHSGDLVLCALSDEPVGIDVELIKPAKLNVAKRFFRSDEYEYIAASRNTDAAFFEIWTMKESYIKRDGRPLSLKSFSVLELRRQAPKLFRSIGLRGDSSCHVCSDIGHIDTYKRKKLSEFLLLLKGV